MESRDSFWATKRRRLNPIEEVNHVFNNDQPRTMGLFGQLSMFASKVNNFLFHRETVMSAEVHSESSSAYSPERRRRKPEVNNTGQNSGQNIGQNDRTSCDFDSGHGHLGNGTAVRDRGRQISDRGGQISDRDRQISDKGRQLSDRGGQISDRGGQISDRIGQISDRGRQLSDKGRQLSDRGRQISDRGGQISDRSGQISDRGGQISDRGGQLSDRGVQVQVGGGQNSGRGSRQRLETITLDEEDSDSVEYVTDDEDDVVEITPRLVRSRAEYSTPSAIPRPRPSSSNRLEVSRSTRGSRSKTLEVEMLRRNGSLESSSGIVGGYRPPVELNRSFEKEDTPFEDALSDLDDIQVIRDIPPVSRRKSSRTRTIVLESDTVLGYGSDVQEADNTESTVWKRRDFEEQPEEEVVTPSGSLSRSSSVEVIGERVLYRGPSSDTISEEVTPVPSSSPSLQLGSEASRTVSPLYLRPGSRDRVDKWSRRNRSLLLSSARNRPKIRLFQSEKWESPINRIRKRLGIGSPAKKVYESVINIEEKERFRRLNTLMEAGGANFVPSSRTSSLRSHSRQSSDSESVVERGKAALHALLIGARENGNDGSIRKLSDSVRSDDGSDVQVLEDISSQPSSSGLSQPVLNRKLSSPEVVLDRWRSGSSIRSDYSGTSRGTSVSTVWDKERDGQLKARWDNEKPSKELYRQGKLSYERLSQQRNRRAHELAIEKRLLIESRHDEDTDLEEELIKKLTITGHVFRNRSRKPVADEFPELSDEAKALVHKAWDRRLSRDERLSGEITRNDLMTLNGLDWLNDEVINSYMNLITERAKNDKSFPKVHTFTTFFYPTLLGRGYAGVRRWTRKVDIFSFDILIMPIHLGAHWCLATVDFENKRIDYYDSMGGENKQCLMTIGKYLGDEMMDKKKTRFDVTGWKMITRDDIPQQMNGSDCGMFTSKFAEYASRRANLTFTQEHMPYFRKRMVYEICSKKLM